MKAMILAAGRGTRMGALTDNTPKPLLKVGDRRLIDWQILRLRDNGFTEIVINLGYLGEQIRAHLGDGAAMGVNIAYSVEPQAGLETGGGVFQALPLLGDAPFLLTNADVFCAFPYRRLRRLAPRSAHLVLVDNPPFKTSGDFALDGKRLARGSDFTFAGISVINPCLFANCRAGRYPIAPLFAAAIDAHTATAEHFTGIWQDVGTPERLAAIK